MNDFEDNSDWEKLVCLSDDELEAAIAKQNRHYQTLSPKSTNLPTQNPEFAGSSKNLGQNGSLNLKQPAPNWDYLLESTTPEKNTGKTIEEITNEAAKYPDWEQAIANLAERSEAIPDWEIVNDDINIKNNDAMGNGWDKASNDVNTEFMREWEESAARISTLTGIDLSEQNVSENGLSKNNDIQINGSVPVEITEYSDWEQAIAILAERSEAISDWETVNDEISVKNNDAMTEGWGKASSEVNTEFMQEWEESAVKISAFTGIDVSDNGSSAKNVAENGTKNKDIQANGSVSTLEFRECSDWEQAIATDIAPQASEVMPWNRTNDIALMNNVDATQSWEIASDEVNTEFMKEWEQSAARISALTGIDLSENDLLQNNEKAAINVAVAPTLSLDQYPKKTEPEKKQPETSQAKSTDDSGPLPPLPVLPPKKSQVKKNSSTHESDWFEKYHDDSGKQEVQPALPVEPKSNYHFDQLAEEICDSDQFSWTSLNQKAQNHIPPKPASVWNPSEKIVIDLEDEEVESTAVWNYNPPEAFAEKETETYGSLKPNFGFKNFDLKKNFTNAYTNLWQKFKIPLIAIAALAGLFGIYSIPFVQKAVTEAGLKSQLLKDANHKDLSGSDFQEVKLEKVNFNGANLRNTNLKKANLTGASLNGAILYGADLSGANLRAVDLRDTKILVKDSEVRPKNQQMTKLDQEDLLMWRIVNQPLVGRNLSNQSLDGFYLGFAMLRKANLTQTNLSWVNFVSGDLSEAQLTGANITGVNLLGANLKGADFTGATWTKHEPKSDGTTTCPNGKKGPCKF